MRIIKKLIERYRLDAWNRERYYKFKGVKIDKKCNIKNVSFGSESYLVTIGNNAQITSGAKIFTHNGG